MLGGQCLTLLLRELGSEVPRKIHVAVFFGFDLFPFGNFFVELLAVGTSWLSGRRRGRNGAKKNAVEHRFAKES